MFKKIKNEPGQMPETLEVRPDQMQRLDKAMKACRDAADAHGENSAEVRRAQNTLQSTLRASGNHERIAFGNKHRPR